MKRIIVAVSGGVDSAVAAHLLQKKGWEVIGVTFDLWRDERPAGDVGAPTSAAADAGIVCGQLGIEHRVLECREMFRRRVVEPFCDAYLHGRTPNPCVLCNPRIKFALLEELACDLDADAIATGHYARVEGPDCGGRFLLRKGTYRDKEQSYVLFGLSQRPLSLTRFPLGTWEKADVRALAEDLGLVVHDKSDSQEICFIPDNDYGAFLARQAPESIRPGPVVDTSGKELGRHEGIHRFTIGQRKGFGIALGAPRYVLRIDPGTATVVLGTREETFGKTFLVQKVNWVSISPPSERVRAAVKIRYTHSCAPALIEPLEDAATARVTFETPESAITPGQAAVFYDGDLLLGGGVIEAVNDKLRG